MKNNKTIRKKNSTNFKRKNPSNNSIKNKIAKAVTSITPKNKNNIPDIISDMLILLYELNKNIREKAIKSQTPFYLINSNFLLHIKNIYNYKKICE